MANHDDEHIFTVNDKDEIKKHMEDCQFTIDQINHYDMIQENHTINQIKEAMIANGVSRDDEKISCLEDKLSKMHQDGDVDAMPKDGDVDAIPKDGDVDAIPKDGNVDTMSKEDDNMNEENNKNKRRVIKGNLKVNGHIRINKDKKVCIGDTCLNKDQLEGLLKLIE